MNAVVVVVSLVLGASLVAALAARVSAPAPSLLVLAGALTAAIPGVPVPRLTPDVVLLVVLPPLISAAAAELSLPALQTMWRPLTFLAVGLVLVSAMVTALVAAPLLHLSGPVALVLGAILASTDPVAVTALARQLRLPDPINQLVQAESLTNDATSLVLFTLAVSVVDRGGSVAAGQLAADLARLICGGVLVGGLTAGLVAFARSRTDEPVAHAVLTFVAPYVAYVAADAAGGAGITAVVTAGLLTGHGGRRVAPVVRLEVAAVSDTVVFVLESVIFALIGLQLPGLVTAVDRGPGGWLLPAAALAATLIGVRFLGLQALSMLRREPQGKAALRSGLVMTWAGTRGVIPIAAALSLPLTVRDGSAFPARPLLLLVAASVAMLTLVGQGLTLAPITRWTSVAETDDVDDEQARRLRGLLAESARSRLGELAAAESASPAVLEEVEWLLGRRARGTGDAYAAEVLAVRLDVLAHEHRVLDEEHRAGRTSDRVWRSARRSLDLETANLLEQLHASRP